MVEIKMDFSNAFLFFFAIFLLGISLCIPISIHPFVFLFTLCIVTVTKLSQSETPHLIPVIFHTPLRIIFTKRQFYDGGHLFLEKGLLQ